MILGIVLLVQPPTAVAQDVGIGGDPTCPYPMRPVGGMCILDPSTYVRPDRDGDGIEDSLDLCPDDPRNECPAAQAMREAMAELDENKCGLLAFGVAVVGAFVSGPIVVVGAFGMLVCTWE